MINREDLINWHKDWENKKISSDAYICFLTAYIEDNEAKLVLKKAEINGLVISHEDLQMQLKAKDEEYNNRTCENCSYCENIGENDNVFLLCKNEDVGDRATYLHITKDFGCNKFEAKDK